ncbi:hypothetical protein [Dietzia sp.]|uniref:hypothetical protein n=1 Tax=Dietzia sp. TaxID=1871616 RepID=UPI002FD8C3F5
MRNTVLARSLAVVGAAALLVRAPVTASAQGTDPAPGSAGSVEGSVTNSAGGALASAGLGDLGSTVARGRCVAADPSGSMASSLDVEMASKEGRPGTAHVDIEGGSILGSPTNGTLRWENTTAGTSGDHDFEILGGMDARFTSFDMDTGRGHVTWEIDANQNGAPLSLAALGFLPMSSAPYTTCTGETDIA